MNQSMIDLKPVQKATPSSSSLIPTGYASRIAESSFIKPGSMLKKSHVYCDEEELPST